MSPHPPSDASLSKRLIAALEQEPRVNLHHNPIRVCVEGDMLRLEGTVESIIVKKCAAAIAQSLAGTLPVVDHLRVAVTETMEDGALLDKVIHELLDEPAFIEYNVRAKKNGTFRTLRDKGETPPGNLDIEVRDGIVTLAGLAGSLTHRRLAEVLVWWTAGCKDVDNRLRVTPPEQEHEGELIDAVRIVLEKDPLVHAGQLHIEARRNTVTLQGYVASDEEKRLAILDTWYIPGVRDVADRIVTRRQA